MDTTLPLQDDNAASDLISTTDAATLLGTTPMTVRRWIDRKELPAQRMGKLYKVRRSDVLAFAASTTRKVNTEVESAIIQGFWASLETPAKDVLDNLNTVREMVDEAIIKGEIDVTAPAIREVIVGLRVTRRMYETFHRDVSAHLDNVTQMQGLIESLIKMITPLFGMVETHHRPRAPITTFARFMKTDPLFVGWSNQRIIDHASERACDMQGDPYNVDSLRSLLSKKYRSSDLVGNALEVYLKDTEEHRIHWSKAHEIEFVDDIQRVAELLRGLNSRVSE